MGVDRYFDAVERQTHKKCNARIKELERKVAAYESVLSEIDKKYPFIDVINMVVKAKQEYDDGER